MSETFEQMALRIWEIECGKTRACSTSKLTLMEITAIAFAAAIRDELAKGAEPAAHLSEIWDGMIERRRSSSFVENRVVELKQECDDLRQQLADIKRPDFREMREMLRAMQAGELTVSRGIEILDMWAAGNWNDDMLPPIRQGLIEEDSMPVEIIDRLKIEIESLRQQLAASQAREQQLREALTGCVCAMQDYQAGISITEMFDKNERLGRLALQSEKQDNAALSAMIAKAGEVMRERAIKAGKSVNPIYGASVAIDAIHPLPQISIDDIK